MKLIRNQMAGIFLLLVFGSAPAWSMEPLSDQELASVRGGGPLYNKEDCHWSDCLDYGGNVACSPVDDGTVENLNKCFSRVANKRSICKPEEGVVWIFKCVLDNDVPCAVEKYYQNPLADGACADNQCAAANANPVDKGEKKPSGCRQVRTDTPPPVT